MKRKKSVLPAAALIGAAGLCWYLGTLVSPQDIQAALQSFGPWAAVGYVVLFTLLPAFFFPVAVLALAGGLLFGLWWGSLYTFLGAILNCTLMFLLARYAGRARIEALIVQKLSPQWQQRLQNLNSNSGFLLLIILRLIPAIPYNLINYAFGLSAMSYPTYILASAIGIIPGTFAFINIGDKALDITSPDFWIAIGLLGLLLAVTAYLGKKTLPEQIKEMEIDAMNKKPNIVRLVILLVVAVALMVYLSVPSVNAFITNAAAVLGSANVDAVIEYIRSFGGYAMVFSFCLMVFSSLIAPLPAFMITLSNAAIFGWWQGAILSWSSAMVGSALCFLLSRGLGRDVVEKFAGKGALASVEQYFEKYGTKTILVCRLLPFVSFDAVSYFAGLTPMKFLPFFIATGLGQTPATIVYSYVGGMLTGGARIMMTGLLCLFAISILVTIIRQVYTDHQAKKAATNG